MASDRDLPASTRIAAGLRQRIVSGQLAPGARMPSTRGLVRRHGVAMATATKALAMLKREGLIRSVPGVGTVVAGPAPPPGPLPPGPPPAARRRSSPPGALAAQSIVAAGIAVADAEGLAALSMRRVAAELRVAPMSLYRHVRDKDDLLLRMIEVAIAERPLPEHPPPYWRDAVELAARALWATFRRHPWTAPALSLTRPQALPRALAYSEWVLAALTALGLEPGATFTAHLTLFTFIRGTAMNLELEADAEAASGQSNDEWIAQTGPGLRSLVGTGDYPIQARILDSDVGLDLDELFEFGLQRFLDGLAALPA